MDTRHVALALALPFAPWAWAVARSVIEEVQRAADTGPGPRAPLDEPDHGRGAHPGRMPVHGPRPRGTRARWEAGFGRRRP